MILDRGCEMSTTRKTITLTEQQDQWIKRQIAAGDFTNDSEYIRDLIRRDQSRRLEIRALREELIRGEQSGEPVSLDSDTFKERMAKKHAARIG